MQANSSPARPHPNSGTDDSAPSWSPDLDPATPGYQGMIAYLHYPDPGLIYSDLYLVTPDGSNSQFVRSFQDLPTPYGGTFTKLAWSPNGREIVFTSIGDSL